MKNNPFDLYPFEYEDWFKENKTLFQSELLVLKQVCPAGKNGIEIGIGSGIFAERLGIKLGIDPSENMLKLARQRNLTVDYGFAEDLPYADNSFNFAVFITSICFIDNPLKALQEAHRVVKENGNVIVAFLDKNSSLGKILTANKNDSKFYKTANFYSVKEIISLMEAANFIVSEVFQTLTNLENTEIEEPTKGFGKGSFVVIKGNKKDKDS
ncbi:MAG: SAM-dependent methyltransferase [Draconibacterium sp.]|nr:MAG: SAM-dependent methyltransferase [Draconibacterium sp.]PIF06563.1 MAG: SAM-dependent methyltransferase [Draconibacterium sp.]